MAILYATQNYWIEAVLGPTLPSKNRFIKMKSKLYRISFFVHKSEKLPVDFERI